MWWLFQLFSVLQENPGELDTPWFLTRTDTPGVFKGDFGFLYFPNLVGEGPPCRAAWFCVRLKSSDGIPRETEPSAPCSRSLEVTWFSLRFAPLYIRGQVCIADTTGSLKGTECSSPDCIFDLLSVQNNVLKVSLLFCNVAVHGVVSHLLSWLDRFFPLIAITNSFAKPVGWIVDFLHWEEGGLSAQAVKTIWVHGILSVISVRASSVLVIILCSVILCCG